MNQEPEKPVRYGLMPAGLLISGLLVMIAIGLSMTGIMDFIRWLARWFDR